MSNKIDKLFSGKLADHAMPPSGNAWSKIEAGLSKKNNVIVWRAAAVFVLLGLLTGSWFYRQSKQVEAPSNLATTEAESIEVTPEAQQAPVVTQNKSESVAQVVKDRSTEKKQPASVAQKKLTQLALVAVNVDPEPDANVMEPEPIKIEPTETVQGTKIEKPIVIEFTLDPVVQNTTAVASAAETEKPALKKIWDKALDIKNGDAELGALRMAKNELFALDFRKDKSKRN